MCRLLGVTNFDYRKHRGILEGFLALTETGCVLEGDRPGHTDGWGIGYYRNGAAFLHKSGKSLLDEKEQYFDVLEKAGRSKVLIVHLRKSAWPETSTARNAHPFKYKNHLFAHNGTIRDYRDLSRDVPDVRSRPQALDTEVYFHFIMNSITLGMENAFRKSVRHIKRNNTYSSLTCLFSDGVRLLAYRDYRRFPDYYTLFRTRAGNADIVSSEPVSSRLPWKMLEKERLLVL